MKYVIRLSDPAAMIDITVFTVSAAAVMLAVATWLLFRKRDDR